MFACCLCTLRYAGSSASCLLKGSCISLQDHVIFEDSYSNAENKENMFNFEKMLMCNLHLNSTVEI